MGQSDKVVWRNNNNDDNNFIGWNLDVFQISLDNVVTYTFDANEFDVLGNDIVGVGFFESSDAAPAQSGAIRLGNTQEIKWRNQADTQDVTIKVNSSNRLELPPVDMG